jgi:hypothetical protein
MLFPFQCEKCGKKMDEDFPIGKAPRSVRCSCGGTCRRVYAGTSLSIRVSGRTSGSTFGEQQRQKNLQASHRMKGRKPPVRTVAYDYGNGDMREV